MDQKLGGKIACGLSWTVVGRTVEKLLELAVIAVLARVLSPDLFGLVAMLNVFAQLAFIFCETGFTAALIHNQNISEDHLTSTFWINLAVGALVMGLFMLCAPFIAIFFDRPELELPAMAFSAVFIISALGVVQNAMAQRELDFKKLAIVDTLSILVSGAIAIWLALKGAGIWSLIAQLVSNALVKTILLWFLSPWRPSLSFSRSAAREIWSYSSSVLYGNTLNYVTRNLDQLLIGKFLGAESLGLYSLTFKIVFFPIQHISAVVSRVMFPALSRLNDSIADVVASYQKTVMAISFVTFPMMVGCFAVAEDLVVVVLGPEWIDAIPLIRILCWVGLIQSVSTTVGILFQSQGRPDIALRFNLLYAAPSMLLATLLGLPWGVVGIAIATLIRAIPLSYIAHSLANQLINLRMTEFYRVLVPQLVLALLMLAVVLLLPPPVSSEGPVVRLVFTVIEGVAVYMFCSVFMFRSAINDRLSPQR